MWKFSYSLYAKPQQETRGQISKNRRLMANYHTFEEGQLPREPKSSPFVSYGGVGLALLAGVISSVITSIPKYFVRIPPLEHAVLRSAGILVFSLPPILYHQELTLIPRREDWPVLLLRGMLFYITNTFRIITVHSLELSEVGVLMAVFPVYVSIFANQFRSEPCGVVHGLSLLINLLGVGFVTNLPQLLTESRTSPVYMTEAALGVSASLAAGLSFMLTGQLSGRLQHLPNRSIIFHSGLPGTVVGSIFILLTWQIQIPECGRDSGLLLVIAILVVTESAIQVYALKMEERGPVSLCSSASQIGCSCVWQLIFSPIKLKWYTLVGICMVLGSALITYIHFYFLSLPKDSPIRKGLTVYRKDRVNPSGSELKRPPRRTIATTSKDSS